MAVLRLCYVSSATLSPIRILLLVLPLLRLTLSFLRLGLFQLVPSHQPQYFVLLLFPSRIDFVLVPVLVFVFVILLVVEVVPGNPKTPPK